MCQLQQSRGKYWGKPQKPPKPAATHAPANENSLPTEQVDFNRLPPPEPACFIVTDWHMQDGNALSIF